MKTSVVMCTYNGEKYVIEQMDSIRTQTCQVDEVLIFDDCSTDGTAKVVIDYIEKYNLTGWRFIINESNKGFNMNFLDGIRQASGDILYYSDQDDIWFPEKVEKMNAAFSDPDVSVCECMEVRFSDNGQDYKLANAVYKGNGELKKYDFFEKMNVPNGTAHTMAFTKELRDKIIPIILKNDIAFDTSMADIGSIYGQYYILGIPLVRHRVHTEKGSENTTKPHYSLLSRARDINRQIASRRFRVGRVKLYRDYFVDDFSDKDKKVIDDYISFMEKRIGYMEERKLLCCFFQTFHYNKMNDLNFCLIDVLAILFNRR